MSQAAVKAAMWRGEQGRLQLVYGQPHLAPEQQQAASQLAVQMRETERLCEGRLQIEFDEDVDVFDPSTGGSKHLDMMVMTANALLAEGCMRQWLHHGGCGCS